MHPTPPPTVPTIQKNLTITVETRLLGKLTIDHPSYSLNFFFQSMRGILNQIKIFVLTKYYPLSCYYQLILPSMSFLKEKAARLKYDLVHGIQTLTPDEIADADSQSERREYDSRQRYIHYLNNLENQFQLLVHEAADIAKITLDDLELGRLSPATFEQYYTQREKFIAKLEDDKNKAILSAINEKIEQETEGAPNSRNQSKFNKGLVFKSISYCAGICITTSIAAVLLALFHVPLLTLATTPLVMITTTAILVGLSLAHLGLVKAANILWQGVLGWNWNQSSPNGLSALASSIFGFASLSLITVCAFIAISSFAPLTLTAGIFSNAALHAIFWPLLINGIRTIKWLSIDQLPAVFYGFIFSIFETSTFSERDAAFDKGKSRVEWYQLPLYMTAFAAGMILKKICCLIAKGFKYGAYGLYNGFINGFLYGFNLDTRGSNHDYFLTGFLTVIPGFVLGLFSRLTAELLIRLIFSLFFIPFWFMTGIKHRIHFFINPHGGKSEIYNTLRKGKEKLDDCTLYSVLLISLSAGLLCFQLVLEAISPLFLLFKAPKLVQYGYTNQWQAIKKLVVDYQSLSFTMLATPFVLCGLLFRFIVELIKTIPHIFKSGLNANLDHWRSGLTTIQTAAYICLFPQVAGLGFLCRQLIDSVLALPNACFLANYWSQYLFSEPDTRSESFLKYDTYFAQALTLVLAIPLFVPLFIYRSLPTVLIVLAFIVYYTISPITQLFELMRDIVKYNGFTNTPGKLRRLFLAVPLLGPLANFLAENYLKKLAKEGTNSFPYQAEQQSFSIKVALFFVHPMYNAQNVKRVKDEDTASKYHNFVCGEIRDTTDNNKAGTNIESRFIGLMKP